MFKKWLESGNPWIWMSAGAVSLSLLMVVGVLGLVTAKGLVYFWPNDLVEIRYQSNDETQQIFVGEIYDEELIPTARVREAGAQIDTTDDYVWQYLLKTGNRDVTGSDFRWVLADSFIAQSRPEDLVQIERREWGNMYGRLVSVSQSGLVIAEGESAWEAFQKSIDRVNDLHEQVREIEKDDIGAINYQIEQLRLKQRRHELEDSLTADILSDIEQEREELGKEYRELEEQLTTLYKQKQRDTFSMNVANGQIIEQPVSRVVRAFKPNAMSKMNKIGHYGEKVWEFISDDPREANTEGGIFPTIFGTVLMVLIMSVLVTPMGVITAVYLREYAKQGFLTRTIRIAVNNLAGVPSIVYGVFGLGFFVYFLGGSIDQLFFPEALPAPTFGTGGIMWASLTLALMTLPVVIVSTEEGLSRVPRAIREGSMALGATKAETLWQTVLPMASPAMMTGLILAVARAAGEVAPLMLVGVVKLAPSMPLDWNAPFLHLERKFMHLGFHIYDVGFQSPNVEAARPLVYATALLLVIVILILNLSAIAIRNRLREKYRSLEH